MVRARIVGTGHSLPGRVVTNFDLEKVMDTSDEWIRQRTGIAQRYLADKGTGTSEVAVPAALQALENAGVGPEDLDMVLCCTVTPDHLIPSSACLIQAAIGAKNAGALDLNAACSGFVYGIAVADSLIRSGTCRTVLLVGAEVLSNHLNWERRDTAVLFGDGAGAVVLRAEEGDNGVLSCHVRADGTLSKVLIVQAGGSKEHITAENVNSPNRDIVMDGRELFKKAVVLFGEAARQALNGTGYAMEDLDLFVPHQANARIIYSTADRVGIPHDKVFLNIDRVANTVHASIPLALHDAVDQGRLKPGNLVMIAAFGAGLTWGASLIRW